MLAADHGIPVVEAGRSELDRMTGGAIHQGLALKVAPYRYAAPDDLIEAAADAAAQPLIVALDGVTDPRNLGAIARSVAAFGGHGILVPVRRSAGVTAGAWKASAGALARVRVAQASNLAQALAAYQEAGLFVVGPGRGAEPRTSGELAAGRLAAGAGRRRRGPRPVAADRRALRRGGPDPDHRRHRVAQRRGGRQHRPVRGISAARLASPSARRPMVGLGGGRAMTTGDGAAPAGASTPRRTRREPGWPARCATAAVRLSRRCRPRSLAVPRHLFVPELDATTAYQDEALVIKYGRGRAAGQLLVPARHDGDHAGAARPAAGPPGARDRHRHRLQRGGDGSHRRPAGRRSSPWTSTPT